MINQNIFREYDIRGIAGKDLSPEVVNLLGKGIGTYFLRKGAKKISIGRDGRKSSPEIRDILTNGLLKTGCEVIDLGLIPTPLSYYSTYRLAFDGSIMITGSHNPPDYNGFKITLRKNSVYGSEIQNILEIIKTQDFETGNGTNSKFDIFPQYLEDISENIKLSRSVKVVIDPGNGVGGLTAVPLLENLKCDFKVINGEIDGNFPNHHPDPTVEDNLVQLKKTVIDGNYELGIAFDGDADRIGIIDEKGTVLWGDQLMAILSRDLLEELPGSLIIGEVKCSQLLFDDIKLHGGKYIMWKVGHSLIKNKMNETSALLAGEMSGHIFYKHRYYGFDDATYVTGRILEIVSKTHEPVSSLLNEWPKLYNTPEIRLECPDEIKFKVVESVKDYFKSKYEVIDVDGMRVIMDGGWGLLRASNTQPVVVMRFEANSQERLTKIQTEVETIFNQTCTTFIK